MKKSIQLVLICTLFFSTIANAQRLFNQKIVGNGKLIYELHDSKTMPEK